MTINLLGKEITIRKSVLILLIISISIILGCIGILITRSGRDIIIEEKNTKAAEKVKISAASTTVAADTTGEAVTPSESGVQGEGTSGIKPDKEIDTIKVYVVGCVKKPGVISLKKGQIINDAVRCAGGLTDEADLNGINMVYVLNENVMLYIRSKKEIEKALSGQSTSNSTSVTAGTANISEAGQVGKGVDIIKDSGSAVISGQNMEQGNKASPNNSKVNLNTATEAELDTLPGIGEATAREIIAYREKNGPFKNIKDIMKIPRIKDSRFNAIKDLITVN